jgi:NAD(P)-dependent dehydrogenase (short-subunit alcohol dehydrogenase family)
MSAAEVRFPSFDLSGRVALVTGAARGLGEAIALALAHAGADVVLGLRDASSAPAVAGEIERLGRRAVCVQMDVLVNNAGLGPENPAVDVTEADFDFTCAVNLKGTFFVSQAVGRAMIGQGGGTIVNLGSQAGEVALPGEAIYCMTKAGIHHLTRCLAIEWGEHNITVNAVAPTFIATPGTAPALEDPAFRADVLERIAGLHRVGEPMDVAGAVVFLASPAASLITGHTMLIDGGWTVR